MHIYKRFKHRETSHMITVVADSMFEILSFAIVLRAMFGSINGGFRCLYSRKYNSLKRANSEASSRIVCFSAYNRITCFIRESV